MIDGLRPYPTMKDSGLPWLGTVPEHWDVRRLKYVLRERDSRSSSGAEQLLRVSQYTGVTERRQSVNGDLPETRAESLVGYKIVEPNDLVVNIMLAWNGSMGLSSFAGIASPAYCVYRFKANVQPWYFHHLLRSPTYRARIKAMSTGVVESRLRLYTDDLYRLEGLLPPLPDQTAIVRFLNHVDRLTRRYVRVKQRLIKRLEEQKQAIIHRAVTSGLDPDVRLKPSGVEWLGDVPEHWKVVRLKSVVTRVTSGSRGWSNFAADSGVMFIRIGNLTRASLELDLENCVRVQLPMHVLGEAARTRVSPGDILLSITAFIGSVAVVPHDIEEAYVSQHVACCRPRLDIVHPRWLGYVLLSNVGQTHGQLSMYGGTKQGLSLDDVKNHVVLLPPLNEQGRLVEWMEQATASLTAVLEGTRREIDFLREFRTRLIADVVTGKLDVREAAARLPDEIDDEEPLDDSEQEVADPEAAADYIEDASEAFEA